MEWGGGAEGGSWGGGEGRGMVASWPGHGWMCVSLETAVKAVSTYICESRSLPEAETLSLSLSKPPPPPTPRMPLVRTDFEGLQTYRFSHEAFLLLLLLLLLLRFFKNKKEQTHTFLGMAGKP